jgi:putative peptidoglycan lipid II flippase
MFKSEKIKSQTISHATFYLVLIGINSTILGFLRELFLAYKFGVSSTTDVFLVAIVPVSFLVYFVTSADVAFVSIFSKNLVKNEKKAWLSGSRTINVTLFFGIILALIFLFFAPFLTKLLVPGFDQAKLSLVTTLLRITIPAILAIPLYIFIKGILNSYKNFTWPAIASLLPNIGVIFGILILSIYLGIKGAVIGLIVGYILQALVPGVKILPFLKKKYSFSLSLRDPEVKKFFVSSFFLILILIGLNIDVVADKIFGSFLEPGTISALNYARKITSSTYFLIAYALSTTLLPTLSQAKAQGNRNQFQDLFQKGLKIMIFILIPASLLLFFLREPILIILFKHGVFGNRDLAMTSQILAIYSGALIGLAGITFLARVFYALDDIRWPALIGVISMSINIIFDIILIKYFSFRGLALASLITANLNFLLLLIYLWYKFRILNIRQWLPFLAKLALVTIPTLIIIFISNFYLKNILNNEFIRSVLQIIISAGLGSLVFITLAYYLKMEEVQKFKNLIKSIIYR